MKKSWSQFKFGILGGGQLARLLCLKGHEMGIKMFVLSEKKDDPAAQVTPYWVKGSPYREKGLRVFLSQVDLVSFENEFLDTDQLQALSRKLKTPLSPRPSLMGKLQDRFEQKKLLKESGLSTSDFLLCKSKEEKEKTLEKKKRGGLVFKKKRSGYDGQGTFIFPPLSSKNPSLEWQRKKRHFLQSQKEDCLAEDFVFFKRELALSVARNASGDVVFLPLVQSHQEKACCVWVKGPIQHPKLFSLKKKIQSFLKDLSYQGMMAFELFDLGKDLLVNEIAPRVHNSAHYSSNALSEDQFTLHLKACLNLPLKTPRSLASGFAMLNLLGGKKKKPTWTFPSEEVFLHWYGKSENRPGRKMGHLNALASRPTQALVKLIKAKKHFSL